MRLMFTAFAFSLAASAAAAQTAPTWVAAPTVADVVAAYPAKARAAGVEGSVLLSCTVSARRSMHACVPLTEEPRGYGFGTAARKLVEGLTVAQGPGITTGADVRVPVAFKADLLKSATPMVAKPRWSELPSAEAFQATFPKTENGVNAVRVALVCTVQADGSLNGCAVDREEPAGMGYGDGALALASKFRVAPWSVDGEPTVGAKVRVPIRYELQQVTAAQR
ncbi:MAG: hypothetical protein ABW360_01620 [Phenylobacterium sp.]